MIGVSTCSSQNLIRDVIVRISDKGEHKVGPFTVDGTGNCAKRQKR